MTPFQKIMSKASFSDEGPSTLEALRRQEQLPHYQCRDYLGHHEGPIAVDVEARKGMLEWVFKVTTFLKLSDEVAMITATILDRYLQTKDGEEALYSLAEYRLVAMASLYMSTKVFEHTYFISSDVMSALSHGIYSPEDVEKTESRILKGLGWHVNPPTSIQFCTEFLNVLPCSVSQEMKDAAYGLCKAQIKQCILDYECIEIEASTVAFHAVQNALKSLGMDLIILGHVASIFCYATHKDYYLDCESKVQDCLNLVLAPPKTTTYRRRSVMDSSSSSHPRKNLRTDTRSISTSFRESPSSVFER